MYGVSDLYMGAISSVNDFWWVREDSRQGRRGIHVLYPLLRSLSFHSGAPGLLAMS